MENLINKVNEINVEGLNLEGLQNATRTVQDFLPMFMATENKELIEVAQAKLKEIEVAMDKIFDKKFESFRNAESQEELVELVEAAEEPKRSVIKEVKAVRELTNQDHKETLIEVMDELEAVEAMDAIIEIVAIGQEPTMGLIFKTLRINKLLLQLTHKDISGWNKTELRCLLIDLAKYEAKLKVLVMKLPRYKVVKEVHRLLTRIDILKDWVTYFMYKL